MADIKVRFAPSPTGFLHIGGLRTALYNYLFAKKNGGKFVLRIEDTDRSRMVEGGVENIVRSLASFGIIADEGVIIKENHLTESGGLGPYLQSERLKTYHKYVHQLLEGGHAYYCFCTPERLGSLRDQQMKFKQQTKYDRHCLHLPEDDIKEKLASNVSHVVRLKVPAGETAFTDIIRGEITIQNSEVDDQVLMKSDKFPTYHLANVVDDHLMGITHVIRGEEWISSTPKHVILYSAFGWDLPEFAHLPLVLNADKSKLSKRQGDVAVEDYLNKGYLPEALFNFIALLGFNPRDDQEIYSRDDLIELFDLSKVNKSGAILDVEKLDWMNGYYIRQTTDDVLVGLIMPILKANNKKISETMLRSVLLIEKDRLKHLHDILEHIDIYISQPEYNKSILTWKKSTLADAKEQLTNLVFELEKFDEKDYNKIVLEEKITKYIKSNKLMNGNVLWPMRVALSGLEKSPGPFELASIFGKEETINRLKYAVNLI